MHYVSYRVTGPTHEQRGGRLVQVRYEELRRYYANSGKIQDIDAGWYTINGQLIPTHDIYTTAQAAESAANAAQISYGTAVKFAQYCR